MDEDNGLTPGEKVFNNPFERVLAVFILVYCDSDNGVSLSLPICCTDGGITRWFREPHSLFLVCFLLLGCDRKPFPLSWLSKTHLFGFLSNLYDFWFCLVLGRDWILISFGFGNGLKKIGGWCFGISLDKGLRVPSQTTFPLHRFFIKSQP